MRILLIGHAYIVAENQKKLRALVDVPGVELRAIVPRAWREPVLKEIRAHLPADEKYSLLALPALFANASSEQFYGYLSPDLSLRDFQPDILYVEQGAGAFVYTQSLLYRNLYAPKAKAVFFTWWNLPYRARWPLSAIERFNLNQTQGAVAGNAEAAGIIRAHGFTGPLGVLPQLGVDPLEFRRRDTGDLRRKLGLDRFTVGYVGRFVEEKGIRIMLEALAGVDFDFQLLMVGRGPLEEEIRAFAQTRSWRDRLRIVSGVNQTEIALYQCCMDVMLVHSLTRPFWKEQFGHVIIEAMACEVPVIGSDSAEVPNVIGEAGIVTPEGDAAALRAALNRVAASPELRQQLGNSGRRRVLDYFTHNRIAQQLVDFFRSLN